MPRTRRFVAFGRIAVALAAAASGTQAATFTLTPLGLFIPWAINASGQIIGQLLANNTGHAALYSSGTITDLGTLGTSDAISYARGFNVSGQIVGTSRLTSGGSYYPFLYSSGVMTQLGTGPGSANGISDDGVVSGDISDFSFFYSGGTFHTFGPMFGTAFAINSNGQMAGTGSFQAFVYSGGVLTTLTFGGSNGIARAINASGQVVGTSYTAGDASRPAFLYSGGVMSSLGTLGGFGSEAFGINSLGQIVGWSSTTGNASNDAFVYSGGAMIDLNSLLPANSGWQLEQATAINDSGKIVGYGYLNGQLQGFLLDTGTAATPEPSSIALFGPGAALLVLRRVRSARR